MLKKTSFYRKINKTPDGLERSIINDTFII